MRQQALRVVAYVVLALAACGDRSPPALWPEPPPPTLAKPIGIDSTPRSATEPLGPGDTSASDDVMDATAKPAPTSADAPVRKGGDPPITADPLPQGRLPVPPL